MKPQESSGSTDSSRSDAVHAYDTWHTVREHASEQYADSPWHVSTLAHLPADLSGRRVLEIGCARGVFARFLAERGADLVAADFSPAAVEYARSRLSDFPCEVLVADIQAMPFDDESFDLVVSQETLEHVPSPQLGLAELVRVLRCGGTLILTGPNYLNLVGLYRVALRVVGRRFTEMDQPINHPLLLYRQVRRLKRLGCTVESVEGQRFPIVIPKYDTIYLRARPQWIARWFALETTIVATRRRVVGSPSPPSAGSAVNRS